MVFAVKCRAGTSYWTPSSLATIGSPEITCESGKEQPGHRCFDLNITLNLWQYYLDLECNFVLPKFESIFWSTWSFVVQLACNFRCSCGCTRSRCSVREPCSPTQPRASTLQGPILYDRKNFWIMWILLEPSKNLLNSKFQNILSSQVVDHFTSRFFHRSATSSSYLWCTVASAIRHSSTGT